MKIQILLSTILLASLVTTLSAFAAPDSATQVCTGQLPVIRTVVNDGGNLTATIDPTVGSLSTPLTPAFKITVNTDNVQTLDLQATCEGASTQDAIYDRGGTRYIILANSAVPPSNGAIADCKIGSPTAGANANAISWAVTEPTSTSEIAYVYDNTIPGWKATLTHKNDTLTNLTIPAAAPFAGTFSLDDADGSYLAAVTLSFNP